MNRPVVVPAGKPVGICAIVSSFALILLYLPGNPSALLTIEWRVFRVWMIGGGVPYVWVGVRYGPGAVYDMDVA